MEERFGMSMGMLSIRQSRNKVKKVLFIVLVVAIIANVWALFTDYSAAKKNEQYGINSFVKEINDQSLTVVLECSGVHTEDYLYVDTGPWHEIQKRTMFGWVKLRCLQDSWTVGAVNKYDITEQDEVYELNVLYQWYYGKLRRGTYRLAYPIKTEKNGNEKLEGYFYTSFQIPK